METGFFFLFLLESQRGLCISAVAVAEQILFFWWISFLPISFHFNSTSLVVVTSWLLRLPLLNFLQFCLFPKASFRLSCVRKQTMWIMFFSVLVFFILLENEIGALTVVYLSVALNNLYFHVLNTGFLYPSVV